MNEIEKAKRAHASIQNNIKESLIILRKPDTQTIHTISPNPVFSGIPEDWGPEDIQRILLGWRVLSGKQLAESIPFPDNTEVEYRKKWFNGGDHDLLKEIMNSGRVPLAWRESWTPDEPRTLKDALAVAKSRGYSVPEKYLEKGDKVTYSEAEAFYAAYAFVSGNFISWRYDSDIGNRWDIVKRWNQCRSFVCQLTSQFIVPDPIDENKTPYFLDQLWIYATSSNQVRLIGLEIDGETHLDEQVSKRDHVRDVMLAAKGYEIYHVAGWWCRIDPYRVICEFLNASGIFPNAQKYIIGHGFGSISDYVCELCHQPMVRWDDDWIVQTELNEQEIIVHNSCAEKISEGYYS